MSSPSKTYQAEIYEQFHEIEETAFRDMVQFYERHAASIDHLEIEAYFEIRCSYVIALFEIGRYRDFIAIAQSLLEGLIYHNIIHIHGEDLFEKILLKKASAHYQLMEYVAAEDILWQLVRMNPEHSVAVFLLKRTIIRNQPKIITDLKGISILFFLTAAALIAVELLIIRPFFPEWSDPLEVFRTVTFSVGAVLLIGSDAFHRIKTFQGVNRKIVEIRANRHNA